VKVARLPRHVKSVHYAWVMLGIAIAMRLVSSVERTFDFVGVPVMPLIGLPPKIDNP